LKQRQHPAALLTLLEDKSAPSGLAVCTGHSIVDAMSTVAEIESAIEKLSVTEQRELADWLNSRLIEDTPEMLAALDAGIRSLETEPKVPLEDVRRKIKAWATT
jgi:phosphoribosylaminoimidazole (AIR) synthetase